MLENMFATSLLVIVWAYFGYPLMMKLWSDRSNLKFKRDTTYTYNPSVSVIIALAGNPSKLRDKITNTLTTRFPHENIEIIVALDGPNPEARGIVDSLIANYAYPNVRIRVTEVPRGGKESAQEAAVELASNDICVFTDLGTTLDENALHNLTRHFYDDRIGAVDGMSRIEGVSNEGLYLRYENKIREWESNTTGLVGLGGCLFAARTDMLQGTAVVNDKLYEGFVPDLQSDFRTALVAKTFGKTAVLDMDAVATFANGAEDKEFGRKHRTTVRAINCLMHNLHLLDFTKYGMFSVALFSHKLLKWLVPFFLVTATIAFALLFFSSVIWALVGVIMVVTYAIASPSLKKVFNFFIMSNLALLKAWYSYWKGERYVYWEPTKR